MDVRMPVLDGREATRRIRAEERAGGATRVPIVALTASVFESEGDALLADGFDQVIHKPYREEQIFAAIESRLGTRFAHEGAPSAAPRQRARILVVDDDPINRTVVRALLQDTHETIEASDGYEALRLLDTDRAIALVLLDVEMAGMGGIETVRRIRADPRLAALPVVAMTAHSDADDRQRLTAAGMDDQLAKPVDPEALLEKVSARLSRRTARATERIV
jgi:CheY-like chemotaxis protein